MPMVPSSHCMAQLLSIQVPPSPSWMLQDALPPLKNNRVKGITKAKNRTKQKLGTPKCVH